jgi:tetratricopeptide (TPR) repeat protein
MSFRTAVTFLLAALLASSAVAQSRGNARLTGKVVDDQGQPIPDVMVKAQMVGQTEVMTGKSDKKGEWRINGLAEGQWRIQMSKEGLESIDQVIDIRNERPAPVTAKMVKAAAAVDPTIEINAESKRAAELAQAGKVPEARKIYEDLLVKYPTVYQLEGFIARTYAAENNVPKALEHLKINLDKEPNNVDLKLLQADLMMESGDKAGARAILDSLDMTQVKDPFPFMNAAITLINEGKGAEAVDSLTKLLAQFPTQNEIYYYRGRAYLSANKFDEAKADLEKFVSLAPTAKEAADAKKILDQLAAKK